MRSALQTGTTQQPSRIQLTGLTIYGENYTVRSQQGGA